jgi:hypothetical protein
MVKLAVADNRTINRRRTDASRRKTMTMASFPIAYFSYETTGRSNLVITILPDHFPCRLVSILFLFSDLSLMKSNQQLSLDPRLQQAKQREDFDKQALLDRAFNRIIGSQLDKIKAANNHTPTEHDEAVYQQKLEQQRKTQRKTKKLTKEHEDMARTTGLSGQVVALMAEKTEGTSQQVNSKNKSKHKKRSKRQVYSSDSSSSSEDSYERNKRRTREKKRKRKYESSRTDSNDSNDSDNSRDRTQRRKAMKRNRSKSRSSKPSCDSKEGEPYRSDDK